MEESLQTGPSCDLEMGMCSLCIYRPPVCFSPPLSVPPINFVACPESLCFDIQHFPAGSHFSIYLKRTASFFGCHLTAPQERHNTTISIRLCSTSLQSLHQDGEGAAHDAVSDSEGVQHRSEPADQAQSTRSHHQLLPHPHLPAAHLHYRLAHVTPKDDNRPITR